jgi:hypothetical protein
MIIMECSIFCAKFEVLTSVITKFTAFLDATPCLVWCNYTEISEERVLKLHSSTLNMRALPLPKMLIQLHHYTRCHAPE